MMKIFINFKIVNSFARQLLMVVLITAILMTALPAGLVSLVAAQGEPGEDWQWCHPYPTGNTLRGITWGADKFVAVGDNGTILTSHDGVSWNHQKTPTNLPIRRVAWVDNKFVAVGDGGAILTSFDGVNWSQQSVGTSYEHYDVIWGSDNFVTNGFGGSIFTSSDGVSWTEKSSNKTISLLGVSWSGDRFVTALS